ncbi:MAG: glutamate racemase, partial [Candidatus Nitrosotenuis sp.]
QKQTKAEIIYFADQKNFPYGEKPKNKLEKIIKNTINEMKDRFKPDVIVVGSNTPSLLMPGMFLADPTVMGVLPPLAEAQRLTKTNSIALLVTHSVAKSSELDRFINKYRIAKTKIIKINSSELVELVESGKFISDKKLCINKIISVLQKKFVTYDIDVATLSSTHLPFLILYLTKIFPNIKFLDPADKIANQIVNHKYFFPSKRNGLEIFSSGDIANFQKNLQRIGIKNIVRQINL